MQEKNQVGMFRRGFAYILDWYVCGVLISLIVGMIWINVAESNILQTDLSTMPFDFAIMAGLLGIAICLIYYFVIPVFIWKGQTPGKKLLNIKIVKENDAECSIKDLFLRQIVSLFFIDAYFTASTTLILQLLGLVLAANLVVFVDYYFMSMTIISIALVLFSPKHKAIHDRIAKTKLITIENYRGEKYGRN